MTYRPLMHYEESFSWACKEFISTESTEKIQRKQTVNIVKAKMGKQYSLSTAHCIANSVQLTDSRQAQHINFRKTNSAKAQRMGWNKNLQWLKVYIWQDFSEWETEHIFMLNRLARNMYRLWKMWSKITKIHAWLVFGIKIYQ